MYICMYKDKILLKEKFNCFYFKTERMDMTHVLIQGEEHNRAVYYEPATVMICEKPDTKVLNLKKKKNYRL